MTELKKCTKCLVEKPTNEFYKNKYSKNGFTSSCVSCIKEYKALNKDKIKEQTKEYNKKRKDAKKRWSQQNKDKVNESRKKWTNNNKEKKFTTCLLKTFPFIIIFTNIPTLKGGVSL